MKRWLLFLGAGFCALIATIWLGGKSDDEARPLLSAIGFLATFALVVFSARTQARAHRWEPCVIAFVVFFLTAIIHPVVQGSRSASSATRCRSNLKQLSIAMAMYVTDAAEHFPPASSWRTQVGLYGARNLRCPDAISKWSYAMNGALSQISCARLSDAYHTVALFEADSSVPNAFGGPEIMIPRHGRPNVVFADGNVGRVLESSRWKP